MRSLIVLLLAAGLAFGPVIASPARAQDKQQAPPNKQKDQKTEKPGQEAPPPAKDINREVTQILRDLQFSLEGSSSRGFLALIDSAKFDDYPRFQDNIERLMNEDSIRAYFRTVNTSPNAAEGKAQTILDAEMEISRKNSLGQAQRRKQQLVIDFENTRRGWRITNITPRSYFNPL